MEAHGMVVKMEMRIYVAKSFIDGMMLVIVVKMNELYWSNHKMNIDNKLIKYETSYDKYGYWNNLEWLYN